MAKRFLLTAMQPRQMEFWYVEELRHTPLSGENMKAAL